MDSLDYSDESFESNEGTEERVDSMESSRTEVDMVADLLMGNEVDESKAKASKSGFRVHDTDVHGKINFDDGKSEARKVEPSGSRYGFSADSPSSMELIEAREQSEKLYQQAFAAKDEIERRLAAGDITDAEAQQALQVAGQYAGMARSQILENEIAQRDMLEYQKQAYAHVAKELDFDPNDQEAMTGALSDAISFLSAQVNSRHRHSNNRRPRDCHHGHPRTPGHRERVGPEGRDLPS